MTTASIVTIQILSTVVAAAVACVISQILQFFFSAFRNSKVLQPKRRKYGPKAWPVLGTVVEHGRNWDRLHDWLTSFYERHHTFTAPMHWGLVCYYTVDVENIKYILKTNFKNFPKGEMFHERMEVVLGDGIFNSDGERWKQQRKTATAEFTLRAMRELYAVAFTEEALKLSYLLDEVVRQGVSVDMQDLFMRMTLESFGRVGLGVDIGTLPWHLPLPDSSFAKAFDFANEAVCRRFLDPFWRLKRVVKVGVEAELAKAAKIVDSFTYGVIAQRKLDISSSRHEQAEGPPALEPKTDLITRFLLLAEDEKRNVDFKFLRDIVLNFLIAGRDTTAVTLAWFVHSIMQKPDIAQRLYEELREFEARQMPIPTSANAMDGRTACVDEKIREFSKLLTLNNLKSEELPFLQAVLSETLRLYPAVPQNPKGILADDVLPDGTVVKGGNIIIFSPYSMARMTYIWGPDAKEFKPERWLQSGKFVPESEFKFTTFQAGLRTCLGRESAYTQLKITAAILCRFFQFQPMEGHLVTYRMTSILSMTDGLKVFVKRREDEPVICDDKCVQSDTKSNLEQD